MTEDYYTPDTPSIKQFKLTNDDEIICEVLQWDDEENRAIVVRAVMRIINIEDYPRGLRFFAFRPWMSFKDDPDELQSLSSEHIIAEAIPDKELIRHYVETITTIKEQISKKRKPGNIPMDKMKELSEEFEGLSDEEIKDMLKEKLMEKGAEEDTDEEVLLLGDSDDAHNVIPFKPPKTIH